MSGVDQLFDRFGDLLKSWVNSDGQDSRPFSEPGAGKFGAGDPFLNDAMAELDAFLEDDKEKQERLRREREARESADERFRASRAAPRPAGPPPRLEAAYKTLGLAYGATFPSVKAAYKKLLKEHHPDKHGTDPAAQKKATETCARINDAFRIIETWHDTGTLGDE